MAAREPLDADDWARGIELSRPNPARMYDYYLGGAHNFAIDRDTAEEVLAAAPEVGTFARMNRAFLQRAVRYLVRAGITQFLDLGSGIPTVGNVHEIAQRLRPGCRVVYVDHEPVAIAQSQRLLADNPDAAIVPADLRRPGTVLSHPETLRLVDFNLPLAVLTISVFPFIPDSDDPLRILAAYRDASVPGSYLALSHGLALEHWPEGARQVVELYEQSTHPLYPRSPESIAELFSGYELVEPGLVYTAGWHPEDPVSEEKARDSRALAGVGRLP